MAQVWLITGSARGLGRAIAEGVLAAGDKLIATARNPQQLSDLVKRYGDNVRAVALDVTDARAAIAAVQLAVDVFGRLDVLVNNAGYGNLAAIEAAEHVGTPRICWWTWRRCNYSRHRWRLCFGFDHCAVTKRNCRR